MQFLKYKFYTEELVYENGEIKELDQEGQEFYFTLTLKSMELFEQEYHKPLISILLQDNNSDEVNSYEFIKALACSTYLKIEDYKILQNEFTQEEFKSFDVYKLCAGDMGFTAQVVGMAIQCIEDRAARASKNNEGKQGKN